MTVIYHCSTIVKIVQQRTIVP